MGEYVLSGPVGYSLVSLQTAVLAIQEFEGAEKLETNQKQNSFNLRYPEKLINCNKKKTKKQTHLYTSDLFLISFYLLLSKKERNFVYIYESYLFSSFREKRSHHSYERNCFNK